MENYLYGPKHVKFYYKLFYDSNGFNRLSKRRDYYISIW